MQIEMMRAAWADLITSVPSVWPDESRPVEVKIA